MSDLLRDLRFKLNRARKEKNLLEMGLIQVIIGDADTIASRNGKITDEEVNKIIRKIITGNTETTEITKKCLIKSALKESDIEEIRSKIDEQDNFKLELEVQKKALEMIVEKAKSNEDVALILESYNSLKEKLSKENDCLSSLLPKTLSKDEIKNNLSEVIDSIKAVNIGQATGIAVKFLKSKNLLALGEDISSAVKELKL